MKKILITFVLDLLVKQLTKIKTNTVLDEISTLLQSQIIPDLTEILTDDDKNDNQQLRNYWLANRQKLVDYLKFSTMLSPLSQESKIYFSVHAYCNLILTYLFTKDSTDSLITTTLSHENKSDNIW